MTHTILPLNGAALTAFGVPLPGVHAREIPMPRQAVDLDVRALVCDSNPPSR